MLDLLDSLLISFTRTPTIEMNGTVGTRKWMSRALRHSVHKDLVVWQRKVYVVHFSLLVRFELKRYTAYSVYTPQKSLIKLK